MKPTCHECIEVKEIVKKKCMVQAALVLDQVPLPHQGVLPGYGYLLGRRQIRKVPAVLGEISHHHDFVLLDYIFILINDMTTYTHGGLYDRLRHDSIFLITICSIKLSLT